MNKKDLKKLAIIKKLDKYDTDLNIENGLRCKLSELKKLLAYCRKVNRQ